MPEQIKLPYSKVKILELPLYLDTLDCRTAQGKGPTSISIKRKWKNQDSSSLPCGAYGGKSYAGVAVRLI